MQHFTHKQSRTDQFLPVPAHRQSSVEQNEIQHLSAARDRKSIQVSYTSFAVVVIVVVVAVSAAVVVI